MSNKPSREVKKGFWREVLSPRRVGQALGAAALVAINPRALARAVRRAFRSAAERRQEEETRRDVQVRLGRTRIRRHLARQRTLEQRLLNLAKRALALGDEARFRQIGKQILWTRQNIQRWERYLLALEMLEARRDQARASVEMMDAVRTISASLESLSKPEDVATLQQEMEKGLAQAASLEERTEVLLEAMDAALESDAPLADDQLEGLQSDLTEAVMQEEQAAFSPDMEADLQRIRDELERLNK